MKQPPRSPRGTIHRMFQNDATIKIISAKMTHYLSDYEKQQTEFGTKHNKHFN